MNSLKNKMLTYLFQAQWKCIDNTMKTFLLTSLKKLFGRPGFKTRKNVLKTVN